jgi:hypothetical protein
VNWFAVSDDKITQSESLGIGEASLSFPSYCACHNFIYAPAFLTGSVSTATNPAINPTDLHTTWCRCRETKKTPKALCAMLDKMPV